MSTTESTILALRSEGKKAKEIALSVGVSENTVWYILKKHRTPTKSLQRQYSDDQEAKVLELRAAGVKVCEIMAKTGLTRPTISRILWNNGVKLPKDTRNALFRKHSVDLENKVVEMRLKGEPLKEIARETGVSEATIHMFLTRRGITLPEGGRSKNRVGSKLDWEDISRVCTKNGVKAPFSAGLVGKGAANTNNEYLFVCKCGENWYPKLHDLVRTDGFHTSSCGCERKSKTEAELYEFVKTLAPNAIKNDRTQIMGSKGKPLELDVFIPDAPGKPLAIEYNGLIFHSDRFRADVLHQYEKYRICQAKGIRLISLYEDEWLLRKEAIKTYLCAVLGLNGQRIGARKCRVSRTDHKTISPFLERYHLQGSVKGCAYYSLILEGKIVGAAVFGRTKIKGEYELSRFCLGDIAITSGLDKILAKFRTDFLPTSVVSFSDNRYSEGAIYRNSGFENVKSIPPDYFYVNGNRTFRKRKSNYRKAKLKGMFPELYSVLKTEKEIMREAKFYQIFDCGKIKWVKKFS